MSEKSIQEHKLLLIIAVLFALAFVVLGVLSLLKIGNSLKEPAVVENDLTVIEGMVRADNALEVIDSNPKWKAGKSGNRELNLVTSLPLFQIPGKKDLIDLDSEGKVHPPIDNKWWLKYGIDPSYKDAPTRDFDRDGFSNLEEFQEKTNPADAKDYPELIDKLVAVSNKSNLFEIAYTSQTGPAQNKFRYKGKGASSSGTRSEFAEPGGEIVFSRLPEDVRSRFVLNSVAVKEVEIRNRVRSIEVATVTDTRKGTVYEIPKSTYAAQRIRDYTVTFSLKAAGQGDKSFDLSENTRFDLPKGNVSDNGKYYFESVVDNIAIVKYKKDGNKKEIRIPLN